MIDFNQNSNKTGFRLHRFEVLNWGTFHEKVWKINPEGNNALLTGDIGSGKSTLVDALTTLLVPHGKITYNKAAGAVGKERTRISYIKGEFKNEKSEDSKAKPVYKRSNLSDCFTVILGYFYNEGYGGIKVTLAQVFWMKNDTVDNKFFVVSGNELSIKEHFQRKANEKDVKDLKKRLKNLPTTDVYDSAMDYFSKFRKEFGITSENALDLFNQTVSMKSIDNLDAFIQNQMLEKPDLKEKIGSMIKNFENLSESHKLVQKDKQQQELLEPIVKNANDFKSIENEINNCNSLLNTIPFYFATEKIQLLENEIKTLSDNKQKIDYEIKQINHEILSLDERKNSLKEDINNNGGNRLEEIDKEIENLTAQKDERLAQSKKYHKIVKELNQNEIIDKDSFYNLLSKIDELRAGNTQKKEKLEKENTNLSLSKINFDNQKNEILFELKSLKRRDTQIPQSYVQLRNEIAEEFDLQEDELPFIGELLKIKDTEKEWEGAIERLLHNFGLSLIVPDRIYEKVSEYINFKHLGKIIEYYRVPKINKDFRNHKINVNSVYNKIEIKDSDYYNWLEKTLIERFNLICCNFADFQEESNAITKEGQIKFNRFRHRKDDRTNINDRKNFILGWSNKKKIEEYETELQNVNELLIENEDLIKTNTDLQNICKSFERNLDKLSDFTDFSKIDWQTKVNEIQKLQIEKDELEKTSSILQSLRNSLKKTETEIREKEELKTKKNQEIGGIISKLENNQKLLTKNNELISTIKDDKRKLFEKVFELITNHNFTLDNIENLETSTRNKINKIKNAKIEEQQQIRDNLIKQMQHYKEQYPSETVDIDSSIDEENINFYNFELKRIIETDLPRHEQRFKDLLNEGTIKDMVLFKNELDKEIKKIKTRIKSINKSLYNIPYDKTNGTYIKIDDSTKNTDSEIEQFSSDLKRCTEGVIGSEQYNENKFIQVQTLINRFKSSDDKDVAWVKKVTDIRNRYIYNAAEHKYDNDSLVEFYSDANGKSGGQKEKLAYTILASALAYHFGLEWDTNNPSRSFRFVVIDEAFGRGSDESTKYGLELFETLKLQLLIVTPLQKINIIEGHINAVHYVANQSKDNSEVKNLTIEEYQVEKEKFFKQQIQ